MKKIRNIDSFICPSSLPFSYPADVFLSGRFAIFPWQNIKKFLFSVNKISRPASGKNVSVKMDNTSLPFRLRIKIGQGFHQP
jgi:hypothetical protein